MWLTLSDFVFDQPVTSSTFEKDAGFLRGLFELFLVFIFLGLPTKHATRSFSSLGGLSESLTNSFAMDGEDSEVFSSPVTSTMTSLEPDSRIERELRYHSVRKFLTFILVDLKWPPKLPLMTWSFELGYLCVMK